MYPFYDSNDKPEGPGCGVHLVLIGLAVLVFILLAKLVH